MPIYEYKCNECGTTSELLQQGMEDRSVNCPDCGSNEMERLLSSSYSFRMGGTGPMGAQAPGTTCCGRAERCSSAESPGGKSCCGSG